MAEEIFCRFCRRPVTSSQSDYKLIRSQQHHQPESQLSDSRSNYELPTYNHHPYTARIPPAPLSKVPPLPPRSQSYDTKPLAYLNVTPSRTAQRKPTVCTLDKSKMRLDLSPVYGGPKTHPKRDQQNIRKSQSVNTAFDRNIRPLPPGDASLYQRRYTNTDRTALQTSFNRPVTETFGDLTVVSQQSSTWDRFLARKLRYEEQLQKKSSDKAEGIERPGRLWGRQQSDSTVYSSSDRSISPPIPDLTVRPGNGRRLPQIPVVLAKSNSIFHRRKDRRNSHSQANTNAGDYDEVLV